MTDSTAIMQSDVIRAAPECGDPFWWTYGDHDKVFASYCQRRGADYAVDDLASDYCQSLPIDEYGRGNVYDWLVNRDLEDLA